MDPKTYARQLVRLSIGENGAVADERVNAVLATLKEKQPRGLRKILQHYLHGIETELRKTNGVIEYAGELPETVIRNLENHLTAERGLPITLEPRENKALIAGVRIHIGDDVIDDSVSGTLGKLKRPH